MTETTSVRKIFTLTDGTVEMLTRQAHKAHLSKSAMVRTLILQNEEEGAE